MLEKRIKMELLAMIALEEMISSIIVVILFNIWKFSVGRKDVHYGIGLGYHTLRILVVVLLFPFFLIFMWVRGGYEHYGFLYVWTPAARWFICICGIIWLIGAVVHCLKYFLQVVQYHLASRSMMGCSNHVCELAKTIAGEMKIRRRPCLRESYSLLSSELARWSRPLICLPVQQYDDEMLRNIITHELVHYKSGDKLVREIMVFLACIHWFNPVCGEIVTQLKTWDEYHCDYITCHCRHIRRFSYCETLYRMYELGDRRKSLLIPGFYEEKSDLRRRLEQMKHYETKTRKKRILAWCAALTFAVAGIVMSLAICEGVAYAYDTVAKTLVEIDKVEEESGTEEGLVEYTWVPDDTTELNYVNPDGISPLDVEAFNCTLKDQIYSTSGIWLKEGDDLTVSVGVSPSDVYVKVGIVQPNGKWRYVYACGKIDHTFEITQNGRHKVFIWNETDTEIKAAGYYMTE